jgi:hypothetical protein
MLPPYIMPDPPIDGWMSEEELKWLYERASECRSVVEIGSWCGKSTHALLSGCTGVVYAVDTFKGSLSEIESVHVRAKTEDIYAEFKKNVGRFSNLFTFNMESIKAATYFADKSVEMVFIDGDHAYPQIMQDIKAWFPKHTKIFCGHDRGQGGVPVALHDCGIGWVEGPGSMWMYSPNIPVREPSPSKDGIATIIPPPSMSIGI